MRNSIIYYLEDTAKRFPDKMAYKDKDEEISFAALVKLGKRIGTRIAETVERNSPVVVYMKKNIRNIECFFGAAYAGCFYIPIDDSMPVERVRLILQTADPRLIICDKATSGKIGGSDYAGCVLSYEDVISGETDEKEISKRLLLVKTTDLLYVLFTSGSTGIPKGVTISHAAVIDFMEWITEKYGMTEDISLCNQAPFYFDASVPDLYIPVACGATTYVPPKSYYTFPRKVISYVIENRINTLIWVPSALTNVIDTRVFDTLVPDCVKLVIFCGEVMPCKYLNRWIEAVPDAKYVNMYGPTEATYACMYYDIDRPYTDEEALPIGKACENSEILLIDDDHEAAPGEIGEICVLGQCLSNGYYRDKERSEPVFRQNPLNDRWREIMYCTGDLGMLGKDGIIWFAGRKDFQIKKNGFRIELGEIENAIRSNEEIENACCVFDSEKKTIVAVYAGSMDEHALDADLRLKLQKYMIPDRYVRMQHLPVNLNGKVDRVAIREMTVGEVS